MTIVSFIGKLNLSTLSFPQIFNSIQLLKLYTQENIQQLDQIFISPNIFSKLTTLSITGDNCNKGTWHFFQGIDKISSLQKLEIWLSQPNWDVCQALLDNFGLPTGLLSFSFGISSPHPELSQLFFEDSNWEDYSIFECPKRFGKFINAIHACRRLQELRIEFDKIKFVKHYNNLFINVCEKLDNLKHLSISIKEPETQSNGEFNQEGTFRFDLILEGNSRLLRGIKSFELTVPTFSLRNLPSNLVISEEIGYLKLSGRLFEETDNQKLINLLGKIRPKEDFRIVVSDGEVDDEFVLRNILESIVEIPVLRSFVYMFETRIDKVMVISVIKEFVGIETAGLIKFSTTSGMSVSYRNKFKEFLRKNRKDGTIQNHLDNIIIRWKPIGAV